MSIPTTAPMDGASMTAPVQATAGPSTDEEIRKEQELKRQAQQYLDKTSKPGKVSKTVAKAGPVPQISTADFQEIKTNVENLATRSAERASDVEQRFAGAEAKERQALQALTEVNARKAELAGDLEYQKAVRLMEGAAERDMLDKAYQVGQDHLQRKIGDDQTAKKYWNSKKSPDELRQLEQQLSDPMVPVEQRASIQLELQRAQETNPQRVLGSTGARVMAAIAQGLGAFGSALTGGPNMATKIIQDAIDHDVQAQLQGKATKGQALLESKSDLTRLRRIWDDEGQVGLALENRKLSAVSALAQEQASRIGTHEAIAKGQMLSAAMDEKYATNIAKMGEIQDANVAKGITLGTAVAKELTAVQEKNQQARQVASERARIRVAASTKAQQSDIGGLQKIGPTSKSGDKIVRKKMASIYTMETGLKRLLELRRDLGAETLASVEKAEMIRLGAALFNDYRAYTGSGANLTGPEIELIDPGGTLQDPTGMGFKTFNIEAALRVLTSKTNPFLKAYGYARPAPTTFKAD